MQEEKGVFSFIGRHKKSALTFLLFITYAGAVFWSNYLSLQRVQNDAQAQFLLEAEKQASAISYFFAERQIETAELAESEQVVNFFRNRDLGMSYQYGLGVNVQMIEDRFEYVAKRKRGGDKPLFSGFMLIDNTATRVAQWNAPEPEAGLRDWLIPENKVRRTRLCVRNCGLVVMVPVWINEAYRGELLAWINPGASFAQFGSTPTPGHGLLVNRESGVPLYTDSEPPFRVEEHWREMRAPPPSDGKNAAVSTFRHKGKSYTVARVNIDDTPLAFVSISTEQVAEHGTARLFVIAAGVVPLIVILVGFLDVLERRRLEKLRIQAQVEAERLAQARSDFLANMSHEIRTPMNAIIGMTELCLATKPSQKQRNYLTKIQQTSDLLLRIINDILDFSKVESGRLELENAPFDLDRVLGDVGNLLSGKAEKKSIEIAFFIDESCNRIFIGDALRLEQVLINLIGNAIKFSEQGNVIIRTRCEEIAREAARLHVEIIDEGIGIAEAQLARLFNAFTQADATTTRRYGGTGLGLAICKQLVELMGGLIGVSRKPGQGSTFSFSIRLGIDPDQQSQFVTARKKVALFARRPVLVIDDNPAYRDAIANQLRQIGLACEERRSGEEAIAATREKPGAEYLAILVDMSMPGMNGVETIRNLRQAWPPGSMPPIFLVTNYSLDVDLEADSTMFDGILTKPTTASRLFAEIAPFLGIRVEADFVPRTKANIDTARLRGLDILVVDDVELNQEVVRDMLTDAGMRVRVAANGSEALAAIAERRPDCVLMDCQMPVMDGFEATRQIRLNPGLAGLPVIALTANALVSEREKCRNAGMDGYVVKPVKSGDLLAALLKHTPAHTTYHEAQTVPPQLFASRPEPGASAEQVLPELPGIEVDVGLRYANGKIANYLKILHLFHDTHGKTFSAIFCKALEQNNWDEATRHAHSLKSAARTIGAIHLGQLAKELEDACHEQHIDQTRYRLGLLTNELEVICSGLSVLPRTPQGERAA
jgi:signal transduction histidine kinase/CheY-like chemotaxis protein/HPt (histidine-containing phosphotransfer) domain-containing protein